MNHRIAATILSVALVAIAGASAAQQRSSSPKPPAPAAKPAEPAAAPAQTNAAKDSTKTGLIYSQWTKICTDAPTQAAKPAERKRACLTGKDAQLASGLPAASVVLIETDKKVLRVLLPLGMQLPPGTRIAIDQGRPVSSPYSICLADGCVAEYEVSGDMLARLKKGKQLAVQVITGDGQAIGVNLPLDEFAKAYDGPPTDTSAFEAEQLKRAEDLRRRINETRMLVESALPQAGSQGGPQTGSQTGPRAAPQAR